ncbi:hypothetical protein Cni_G27877 [Canna indica]|uniref:Uncharacterized protein n=1 Tax=Canna indica TaxID=4628 RepID=A0AAQ3QSN6_9LILI|nr:hypothetical protein Cni_G27877 [Canna indica]
MDRTAEFLTAIYRLGPRKIAFIGLSPIGYVLLERTTNLLNSGGCVKEYNKLGGAGVQRQAAGVDATAQHWAGGTAAEIRGSVRQAASYD